MTQTVIIESVLFASDFGGSIFSGSTEDGSRHRFVSSNTAMPRAPTPGELWEITGTIKNHPQYGPQVKTKTAILVRPSGRLIINLLTKSSLFPGIGKARSEALWDRFGEELYSLLDDQDSETLEEEIGRDLAKSLLEGWQKVTLEAEIYRWLDRHAVSLSIASKIIKIYGKETIEKLDENPYRLLAFSSWKQADTVGSSMGLDKEDPRRLIAAADAVVYQRLSYSHTLTSEEQFIESLKKLLNSTTEVAEKALVHALKAAALVKTDGSLQGLGPASMEQYISGRAKKMAAGEFLATQGSLRTKMNEERLRAIFNDIETLEGFKLNSEQKKAVEMASSAPISVLTGGAGVGKTTVLKAIHLACQKTGCHIFQMALAGRAATRMTEATERPATTIMKFLNTVDQGKIELDREPLIVIDESSMVDLPTMYKIMRRMKAGCRLLLVGDPAQLPPIGFGLVFHEFCKSAKIPKIELTEVHRQTASTGIPGFSASIRNGTPPALGKYEGKRPGVTFIDAEKDDAVERILDIVNDLGGMHESRVIGAIKGGPAGTKTINKVFHELLTPGKPETAGFAQGEPVIWTENNYDLCLMNGSLGTVTDASFTGSIKVNFEGEDKMIPEEEYDVLEHAYAITCHKSQGSQFKRVIIPIYSSKLLDRTLLYTAVTRAQEQVVLIGDRDAFEAAVKALPNPSLRETGLHEYLM
ncbi:AAA family ATPase [Kiloniella sp.]|uniref:AAA family ATPase n=1 Tax=Kiloniella sp. TaxID=1938587 RepID=UPI003A8DEC3F